MGPYKKYVVLKFPIFEPPPPLFIAVCLTGTPQQMFILVSYPLATLKKSYATFMNFRVKNRGLKREKRNKRSKFFYTVVIHNDNKNIYKLIKKMLNEKNVYAFLIKQHLYMLE